METKSKVDERILEELNSAPPRSQQAKCKLGPVQTPLHSCAEPNSIKYDFGATLERRLIQTAYLRLP